MIYGILGMIEDERNPGVMRASPCGCGKTNFLVYLAYQEYITNKRPIVTNFHTRFKGAPWGTASWSTYMSSQEIFDNWFDLEHGTVICITELQSLFNSAGRSAKVITYIEKCLQQRRKMGFDLIWDSQSWSSGDRRIRKNTDYIYRPEKWHCRLNAEAGCYVPYEKCVLDNCDERHQILVYQEYPEPKTIEDLLKPKLILNSWEIGELYDTTEVMKDTLKASDRWEEK